MIKRYGKLMMATAPLALMTALATPTNAGEIVDFGGVFGEGYLFADITEGVAEPGIKIITTDLNNDDFATSNGFSASNIDNCLMSNLAAGIECDASAGAGKRIKTNFTGDDGFDLRFLTADSSGVTEYFTYGKATNLSGARLMGYSLQIGTGTGEDFALATDLDLSDNTGVLFDALSTLDATALAWDGLGGVTTGQNPLQRTSLPDGLFGDGGQEGTTGFFDPNSAGFVLIQNADGTIIEATELFGAAHIAVFGDGLLDRGQIPDGYFYDDDGLEETEGILLAWYDNRADSGAGAWVYGDGIIGETKGAIVDPVDLAAWEANAAYEVLGIEDLSNLNLNFSIDVGDLVLGEFTLRFTPVFADIVEEAASDYQFAVAGSLDAANIPYLNADTAYLGTISSIMGFATPEERQLALERQGYSFLGAYSEGALGLARAQTSALDQRLQDLQVGNGGASMSSRAPAMLEEGDDLDVILSSTSIGLDFAAGGNLNGFIEGSIGMGTFDTTLNSIGYDLEDLSLTAGIDYGLTNGWVLGASVGYGASTATILDDRGSLDTTAMGGMLYAMSEMANGAYINGMVGMYGLEYDSVRYVSLGDNTYLASTTGTQFVAGVSGGLNYDLSGWTVGPVASAKLISSDVNGFTETGGDPLNAITVEDFTVQTTLLSIGVQSSKEIETSNGTFIPSVNLAFVSETTDSTIISTAFAELPAFGTPVDGRGGEYLDLNLGMTYLLNRSDAGTTALNLGYEGIFAGTYESHRASVGAQFTF